MAKAKFNPEDSIRVKDIPIIVRLEDLCENVGKAFRIMELIRDGKHFEAFDIAVDILKANDAIIEQQVNKEEVMKIINKDKLKLN